MEGISITIKATWNHTHSSQKGKDRKLLIRCAEKGYMFSPLQHTPGNYNQSNQI